MRIGTAGNRFCRWGIVCLLLAVISTSAAGEEDVPTVEDANQDFTQMTLEELLKQDARVLELAREVTLQEGILGGHIHRAGEVMWVYQYRFMQMDGNREGTRHLSDREVLADFLVAPTDMTSQTHMVALMQAPSDEFTWMVALPYRSLAMNHITRTGRRFHTDSEGIGDVRLTGFFRLFESERKVYSDKSADEDCWAKYGDELHEGHFALSFFIPTGSIDERADTPMSPDQKLPYPMQLGSGTFDLEPRFVYTGVTENWAWGAHVGAKYRLGRNSNGYSYGDRVVAGGWVTRKLSDRYSAQMRITHNFWEHIDGNDPELNPLIAPTFRADLQGGTRTDMWFGINRYVPDGRFEGNRFHVGCSIPLHQVLDGPQLGVEWQFGAGWSWTY